MKIPLFLIICGFLLVSPAGVQAQEEPCNSCLQTIMGCIGEDSHWDSCGAGAGRDGWEGGCVDGCKTWAGCGDHEESGGCEEATEAPQLDVQEVSSLVQQAQWVPLAEAALRGTVSVDSEREMLFVFGGCGRTLLTGQVPLGQIAAERVQSIVLELRSALLAELDR